MKTHLPDEIWIGREGEQNARAITFDISTELSMWANATPTLIYVRPGEKTAYPATTTLTDGILTWIPDGFATALRGARGFIQIIFTESADETVIIGKSKVMRMQVCESLNTSAEPPEPWESWIDDLLDAAAQATTAATNATEAAQDATDAAADARSAVQEAEATVSALNTRVTEVENELDSAERSIASIEGKVDEIVGEVTAEGVAQVKNVKDEGTAQVGNVTNEGTTQIGLVGAEGTRQIGLVIDEGTTQIGLVSAEGTRQVGLVEEAGAEEIAVISTSLVNKADVICDTASGAIASFPDGANNAPIKSLTAQINPVQSGSGDPSPTNIRAISGYDSVNIYRYAGNAFIVADANWKNKYYLSDSGVETSSNNYKYSQEYFPISPSTTYYISYTKTTANSAGFHVCLYDSSKTFISREVIHSSTSSTGEFTGTIMTTASTAYFRISCAYSATAEGTGTTDIFIANGTTKTIALPSEAGTVYGGNLVINEDGSGVLTVTHSKKSFSQLTKHNQLPDAFYLNNAFNDAGSGTAVSNQFVYKNATLQNLSIGEFSIDTNYTRLCLQTNAFSTKAEMDAHLSTNPLVVVYPLATPIEYQLTAQQITTLLGVNNIWADTGDVSVNYRADTKLYIDKKVASLV